MPKRKATRLTVDDARTQIAALVKKPVAQWNSDDWGKRNELAERAPADVPNLAKLLATFDVSELAQLPTHLDDAILAAVEARPKNEDAAFVIAALRTDRRAKLRELLDLTGSLPWAAKADPARLAKLVKQRPDVVEGARAAMALAEPSFVVNRYLPVLVADATPDSLDLIVPHLEQMVKDKDGELDWFRKAVVPLFGDTPAAHDVIVLLASATEERTKVSPARAFAKQLGMNPPPALLEVMLSFRDERGVTVYQIKIDSKLASWMQGRRNHKWLWRTITVAKLASELPAERRSYVLRVTSGDRKQLDSWASSLLLDVAG